MKSTAPWSVKGIEQDARERAKEAARREGKTLGEWLNGVIYTAGDPEVEFPEDGVKMRDLAVAIEFLNQKTASAEEKTLASVNNLARSFSNVVERVQRLERENADQGSDSDDGDGRGRSIVDAQIVDRLEAIEEKVADTGRIDALKALEKAVTQVALQFNTSQREALARLDASENTIHSLAERLDALPAAESVQSGDTEAIGFLKDAVDGMSSRIARAERIASEASKIKADAQNSADAEFVERTGKRLRVLGDEIKRGGDQTRALEASIARLAGQIDAAEKRSAESVAKVATTISTLREELKETESVEAEKSRRTAEAAVTALAERTDVQVAGLHSSFEEIIHRLDALKDGIGRDTTPEPSTPSRTARAMLSDAAIHHDAPAEKPSLLQTDIDAALSDDFDDDITDEYDDEENDATPLASTGQSTGASSLDDEFDDFLKETAGADSDGDDDFSFELEGAQDSASNEDVSDQAMLAELDALTEPKATTEKSSDAHAESLKDIRAALGFAPDQATDSQNSNAPIAKERNAFNQDADDLDLDDLMSELDDLGDPLTDTDRDLALLDEDQDEPAAPQAKKRRGRQPENSALPLADISDDDEGPALDDVVGAGGDDDLLSDEQLPIVDDETVVAEKPENYLKAARAAAKEAASRAEEASSGKVKRKLSPRQRALLAAKRKRAQEKANAEVAVDDDTLDEGASPNPTRSKRTKTRKSRKDRQSATAAATAAATSEDALDDLTEDDQESPAAKKAFAVPALSMDLLRSRPVTAALAVAVILVFAALAFFLRDAGSNADNNTLKIDETAVTTPQSQTAATQAAPEAAITPTLSPRELYLEAMASLATAATDVEERDALRFLQEAAALGHPPAQLQLGEFFKLGRGVERDFERARAWYERAANGGNILAMHRLGVMTARGEGGPKDLKASVNWFEQAGGYGLVDSQYNLGATLHPQDDGDPAGVQDTERAYYWYGLAARNGDQQAGDLATGLSTNLSEARRQELDAEIAAWTPIPQDPAANERAGA